MTLTSNTYFAVIALSLLSVFTTTAGVVLAIRIGGNHKSIAAGMGFATGIMPAISVFELIPEASAEVGLRPTLAVVGLGALVLFGLHLALPPIHLFKEENGIGSGMLKSAYLVVFGLILHDFPEGLGMANAYIASPSLGFLVAVAIALHNLPGRVRDGRACGAGEKKARPLRLGGAFRACRVGRGGPRALGD